MTADPAATRERIVAGLDVRLRGVVDLLQEAPLAGVKTVLDVGAGQGEIAQYLATYGKDVTCTGLAVQSYLPEAALRAGISYVECDIARMPFADGAFDAALLCHVLEHCPNVSVALAQVRRVLRDDGLLLVFVPPQEDIVCAGHVSVGWNVGQLMYVLLLNGFNVASGMFIEHGYNVCAIVRRSTRPLPPLRHDRGDISMLSEMGYFPVDVRGADAGSDAFNGLVKAVNWKHVDRYGYTPGQTGAKRLFVRALDALPARLKRKLGAIFIRVGRMLLRLSVTNPQRLD